MEPDEDGNIDKQWVSNPSNIRHMFPHQISAVNNMDTPPILYMLDSGGFHNRFSTLLPSYHQATSPLCASASLLAKCSG